MQATAKMYILQASIEVVAVRVIVRMCFVPICVATCRHRDRDLNIVCCCLYHLPIIIRTRTATDLRQTPRLIQVCLWCKFAVSLSRAMDCCLMYYNLKYYKLQYIRNCNIEDIWSIYRSIPNQN